ncbi:MAG: protein BatD [Bdellovibrionales bacterium]|nr:protein BatD [Bdellovibrionales bacterium]
MTKTGSRITRFFRNTVVAGVLFFTSFVQAAIQASVDRTEVPLDESVTLKITASGGDQLNPKFDAPDFEIMNQFENSQFQSVYVNGKFENKSERSITYILRPTKVGSLKIKNIVNGGDKAPDLSVQVAQDNPYNKHQITGDKPQLNADQKNFFMRAEVNKSRIYKGEQLIVSYYLYRRTRVNIRDVMQYPSFEGFIREDLEMPILSGRPDYEAVSLGGIPFERALLARYALYPIRDGKLKIDSLNVRADYIPRNQANDDMMEDPFFQFFTQVTPRTATSKSDPITVEVSPVPEEGKTQLFTGGVGNFDLSAQLDLTTMKAYSPLTLRVSIRGKGNTNLIEFPPVNWPKQLKFYETQGKSKNLGQGVTEKTFEIVLIPQEKGNFEIPPIEFEFFNPEARAYVRKKTAAIPIQVSEGDPNAAPAQPAVNDQSKESGGENNAPDKTKEDYGALRTKNSPQAEAPSSFLGQPWWRWVAWFGLVVLLCFVSLVLFDETKKRSLARLELIKRRQGMDSWWNQLQREAQELSKTNAAALQFSEVMEKVVDQLYQSLDEAFGITSRAMPQRELAKVLTDNFSVRRDQWQVIASIFEFSETIRFASQAGIVSDQDAQQKTPQMIENAKKLCADISAQKG